MTEATKRVALHFRVMNAAPSAATDAALHSMVDQTRKLFVRKAKISPEMADEPQYSSDPFSFVSPPPDDQKAQGKLLNRLRAKWPASGADDVVVYLLEMTAVAGLTSPYLNPEILIDFSSAVIDDPKCTWVLAHELGHLLGGSSGESEDSDMLMYLNPCNVSASPPHFEPGMKKKFRSSGFCQ